MSDEAFWHRYGYDRVVAHTARFADMVRALDAAQLRAPVPQSDWCVAEVVAHLASVWRRYTTDRARAGDAAALATQNAEGVAAMGTDVDALLLDMSLQLELLGPVVEHVPPATTFPFHAGQVITMAGGWGNALSELLVHGDDIARAAGVAWTVDGADLEPFWRYTMRVAGGWLSPAGEVASARWDVDLGFASGPVRLAFDAGRVSVDPVDAGPPDHVLTGDAALVTLTVPWRRRPADDPAAQQLLDLLVVG